MKDRLAAHSVPGALLMAIALSALALAPPLVGAGGWPVALVHCASAARSREYNPGLWTACGLFLPLPTAS